MDNPLVSIIIPNYNHAEFLQQRIESVLNQTFQNFEVILLDDASTDKSVVILKKYENHPKVKHLIINEVNTGSPFKQWHKGIALAQGEYVWIAESDDYSDLDFLEQTVEKAKKVVDFGFIFTNSYSIINNLIAQKVSESNREFKKFHDCDNAVIDSTDKISKYLIKNLLIYNVSSVLFNKRAFEKVDYKKLKEFKNTGDRFVYISIALNFKCYYLNQPLNYFRIHQNNTTSLNLKNGSIFLDRLYLIRIFIQNINDSVNSKRNMVHFFNCQFFNSINYKFYSDLLSTLNKLYEYNYIGLYKYSNLCLFILLERYFKKLLPPLYRKYIMRFF